MALDLGAMGFTPKTVNAHVLIVRCAWFCRVPVECSGPGACSDPSMG
jgi:hypothetical protein